MLLPSSASSSLSAFSDFSVERRYGIKLHINELPQTWGSLQAVDVETDERDNFVGLAVTGSPSEVWYFSDWDLVKTLPWHSTKWIGHNIKSDLHWLWMWGLKISPANVHMDTMLMSYVLNATKESHGLKVVAKEFLRLEWPSYRDIVGKGRKRLTLDKQPLALVANYCGMDAVSTFRLYQFFMRRLSCQHMATLNHLEMPIMRLLFTMEDHGLLVDVPYLKQLEERFVKEIKVNETELVAIAQDEKFNPRSPKQVLQVCRRLNIPLQKSADKKSLLPYRATPFVSALFRHRENSKLYGTYVRRYLELPGLPTVHPDLSQVSVDESTDEWKGIRTGRLSSDYHNIPRRSDNGKLLRAIFVAPEGKSIICGDYSQIEYRLLAHFSKEPLLLDAFKQGRDVHEETAKLFGSADRDLGKTLNFAAIYGAHAKKIAATANISVEEAQSLLDRYWKSLRRVTGWIARTKFEAKQRKGVRTLLGRFIPIPGIVDPNPFERFHAERQAVNYVIQGSAADTIKLAMIRCQKAGFVPVLQVHDELLFESATPLIDEPQIKEIMESVVMLDVPLEVDLGHGKNWSEAKA